MRLTLVLALTTAAAGSACVSGAGARGSGTTAAEDGSARVLAAASLVGAWQLVSILDSLPDGSTASWMGEHPEGMLVYDAAGHVSVHIMNPTRRPRFAGHGAAASDSAVRAAYDTYYAYYGRYEIFPDSQVVIHHVEGSLEPAEVGLAHRRPYRLDGDRLLIRSTPERGGVRYHRWLTWRRAR